MERNLTRITRSTVPSGEASDRSSQGTNRSEETRTVRNATALNDASDDSMEHITSSESELSLERVLGTMGESFLINLFIQFTLYIQDSAKARSFIHSSFSERADKIQSIIIFFEKLESTARNWSEVLALLEETLRTRSILQAPHISLYVEELLSNNPGKPCSVKLTSIVRLADTTLITRINSVLTEMKVPTGKYLQVTLQGLTELQKYSFLCSVFRECLDLFKVDYDMGNPLQMWTRVTNNIRHSIYEYPELVDRYSDLKGEHYWSGSLCGQDTVSALVFSRSLLDTSKSEDQKETSRKDTRAKFTRNLPQSHYQAVSWGQLLLAAQTLKMEASDVVAYALDLNLDRRATWDNLPSDVFIKALKSQLISNQMFIDADWYEPDDMGFNWRLAAGKQKVFYQIAWNVYLETVQTYNRCFGQLGNARIVIWRILNGIAARNVGIEKEELETNFESCMSAEWLPVFKEAMRIHRATGGFDIPWNRADLKDLFYSYKDDSTEVFLVLQAALLTKPIQTYRWSLPGSIDRMLDCITPIRSTKMTTNATSSSTTVSLIPQPSPKKAKRRSRKRSQVQRQTNKPEVSVQVPPTVKRKETVEKSKPVLYVGPIVVAGKKEEKRQIKDWLRKTRVSGEDQPNQSLQQVSEINPIISCVPLTYNESMFLTQ